MNEAEERKAIGNRIVNLCRGEPKREVDMGCLCEVLNNWGHDLDLMIPELKQMEMDGLIKCTEGNDFDHPATCIALAKKVRPEGYPIMWQNVTGKNIIWGTLYDRRGTSCRRLR